MTWEHQFEVGKLVGGVVRITQELPGRRLVRKVTVEGFDETRLLIDRETLAMIVVPLSQASAKDRARRIEECRNEVHNGNTYYETDGSDPMRHMLLFLREGELVREDTDASDALIFSTFKEGASLERLVWQQADEQRLFQCLHFLISNLTAFHRAGYVHGDVNVRNIIFDGDRLRAWLVDFEHSRHLAATEAPSVTDEYAKTELKDPKRADLYFVGELFFDIFKRRFAAFEQFKSGPNRWTPWADQIHALRDKTLNYTELQDQLEVQRHPPSVDCEGLQEFERTVKKAAIRDARAWGGRCPVVVVRGNEEELQAWGDAIVDRARRLRGSLEIWEKELRSNEPQARAKEALADLIATFGHVLPSTCRTLQQVTRYYREEVNPQKHNLLLILRGVDHWNIAERFDRHARVLVVLTPQTVDDFGGPGDEHRITELKLSAWGLDEDGAVNVLLGQYKYPNERSTTRARELVRQEPRALPHLLQLRAELEDIILDETPPDKTLSLDLAVEKLLEHRREARTTSSPRASDPPVQEEASSGPEPAGSTQPTKAPFERPAYVEGAQRDEPNRPHRHRKPLLLGTILSSALALTAGWLVLANKEASTEISTLATQPGSEFDPGPRAWVVCSQARSPSVNIRTGRRHMEQPRSRMSLNAARDCFELACQEGNSKGCSLLRQAQQALSNL